MTPTRMIPALRSCAIHRLLESRLAFSVISRAESNPCNFFCDTQAAAARGAINHAVSRNCISRQLPTRWPCYRLVMG